MARAILPEDLWTLVEPFLPPDKPLKSNGRPAVANRDALTGILFVLRTGIPWEYLPQEMGLRVRNDLLASLGQVAGVGRLATRVRGVAGAIAQGRPDRLVAGGRGFVQRPRRF